MCTDRVSSWKSTYSYGLPSVYLVSYLQTENSGFDLQLVESSDVKPGDTEGQLYSYWKKIHV